MSFETEPMKRTFLTLLTALFVWSCADSTNLESAFRDPSGDAKPWTLWYWMYGAVSDEGLRADLEAMADAGLGGAYIVTIRSSDDKRGAQYAGDADQLTANWWQRIRTAFTEADRLGLQLGVHISDGFALAGGPWISPAESMQKVVFAEHRLPEGGVVDLELSKPAHYEDYYEDIALYALPAWHPSVLPTPQVRCENLDPQAKAKQRVSMDEKGVIRAGAPCRLIYTFPEEVEVRNVEIILSGNNYQAHRLRMSARQADGSYAPVAQLVPARHGWQNTDFQSTHAVPPTASREFCFEWSPAGSEPGAEDLDAAKWKPNLKIKEIRFGSEPRIHQWEGKAGYVWRVADATGSRVQPSDCYRMEQVICLTDSLQGDHLRCTLPEGAWRILRIGHTSTGHTNATGGAGRGLECDKFSRAAVGKQIDNWFGAIYRAIDPAVARRVLKSLYVDSWECGSQNWSNKFAEEFKTRRGYALEPWLPLFAGVPMVSAEESERVLRDIRTTIGELIHDVFFDVLAEKADEYDCRFTAESVAPTMVSDGMLHYNKVDLPMGEFWLNSPTHDKPNDMLDAVSGGRVYGKKIISAEGFTELRGVWDATPATLKPLLDRNYALGLNRLVYHVCTHNPWLDRRPGMTLDGIGLFFQRDNTWYRHGAQALSLYAARCQTLLQYGEPVVDIAVFTGEEMPRRSILPDRLVSSLPGLFGAERVEAERRRLANEGTPTRVKPVGVTHSANMADPEQWVNPLRGYAYDSFNRDALLRLAKVHDGRLTTPHGPSYRIFVVPRAHPMNPERPMSEEVQAKLEALRKGGVLLLDTPYQEEDFSACGIERDVVLPEGVAWTHRRCERDDTDLYFLANQTADSLQFTASLRVAGRVPELWNPLDGSIADAATWRIDAGRTEVEISLAPYASCFVVLRRAGTPPPQESQPTSTRTPLLAEGWQVTFDRHEEPAKVVEAAALFDWTTHAEEQVRYFSGTATYRTTFHRAASAERVVLQLGEVRDVAAVRLNGTPCGVAWTAPYEVDITSALCEGENHLEIEVSNCWANALLGAAQGKAPFAGIWTNAPYRRKEQTLLPSGLLGPLHLIEINRKTK